MSEQAHRPLPARLWGCVSGASSGPASRGVRAHDLAVAVEEQDGSGRGRHHGVACEARAATRHGLAQLALQGLALAGRTGRGARRPLPGPLLALPPEAPLRRAYLVHRLICMLPTMRVLLPDGNELTLDEGASGRDAVCDRLGAAGRRPGSTATVRELRLPARDGETIRILSRPRRRGARRPPPLDGPRPRPCSPAARCQDRHRAGDGRMASTTTSSSPADLAGRPAGISRRLRRILTS